MNILLTILTKLGTYKFIVRVFLHVAEYLAKRTENKLDDKIIEELKEALK